MLGVLAHGSEWWETNSKFVRIMDFWTKGEVWALARLGEDDQGRLPHRQMRLDFSSPSLSARGPACLTDRWPRPPSLQRGRICSSRPGLERGRKSHGATKLTVSLQLFSFSPVHSYDGQEFLHIRAFKKILKTNLEFSYKIDLNHLRLTPTLHSFFLSA